MIKINELRVGNWIDLVNPMSDEPNFHQYDVTDDYINIEAYGEPIRINRIFLVNIGFVTPVKMCDTVFFKDKIMLDFHNGVYKLRDFGTVISSAHELQNIYYAINYRELEININTLWGK